MGGLPDSPLAAGAAAHGAIGEEERHAALRREVMEHVLDPGEVRVAPPSRPSADHRYSPPPPRRGAVAPARVALQLRVPPFADVERRVGHHVVGSQVGVLVAGEGVGRFLAEIEVDAADGHVHRRESPSGGIALLPIDGEVAQLAAVLLDEALALDEEPAGAHGRIIDAPW